MGRDCVGSLHTADPNEVPSSVIPIEQSVNPFLRARVNQSLQGCTSLKHPPLCSTIGLASHLEEVSSLDFRYPSHLLSDGEALASIHTELPFSFC